MVSFVPMRLLRTIPAVTLLVAFSACASVEFSRTTETSGTFVSRGRSFTIFSVDIPKEALQIARENAADAGLANMKVTEVTLSPDWGWWSWVLDIMSVRNARIEGTWGFEGE